MAAISPQILLWEALTMHRTGPGERQMADVNPWPQVVGTVAGALVGGLMTFAGGFTQQWMASGREREARREEIEVRRTQQRKDFQIQTLVDLQDAMLKLQDATWKIKDKRSERVEESFKVLESWSTRLVPGGLGEGHDAASARTYALMVRVQDERIRNLIAEFRDHAHQSRDADSESTATMEANQMNKAIDQANTRIGEVLRSLY